MPEPPAILIVDEDADAREMLRLALEGSGFVIRTADDHASALDALRSSGRTVCVLLDLDGGRTDAARFRAAQRRDRSLAWIPVVVVSSRPDIAELARQLGAAGVLPKPFDLERLRQVVRDAAFVGATRVLDGHRAKP